MDTSTFLMQQVTNTVKSVTYVRAANSVEITLEGVQIIEQNSLTNEITFAIMPSNFERSVNNTRIQSDFKTDKIDGNSPTKGDSKLSTATQISQNISEESFAELLDNIIADQEKADIDEDNKEYEPNGNTTLSLKTMKIFIWNKGTGVAYPGFFSWQSLSYASPKHDIIILNDTHKKTLDMQWWKYTINHLLNISDDQIYWTTNEKPPNFKQIAANEHGYTHIVQRKNPEFMKLLTEDIIQRKLLSENYDKVILVPRKSSGQWFDLFNAVVDTVSNKLKIPDADQKVVTSAMPLHSFKKYGNKACLHRDLNSYGNVLSLMENANMYENAAPMSKQIGYACYTKEEALIAYDLVIEQINHSNILLKNAYAGGGFQIYFFKSVQELKDFEWPSIKNTCFLVEENLHFDRNGNKISKYYAGGKTESVGVTFENFEVIGWPCEQLLKNECEFIGGAKYNDYKVSQVLMDITAKVIRTLNIRSRGGFDFIVQRFDNSGKVEDMKFFLIDMNVGRNTANHQSFCVMEKFGINVEDVAFLRKNVNIPKDAKFSTLMEYDSEHGCRLLFNGESKRGVFTHAFCAASVKAVLTVVAENMEECWEMVNKYESVINNL